MIRIKGRYVANVIIEWDHEREPNMLSIEQIKDNAKFLSQTVTDALMDAVQLASNIEVNEQYCDFYEMEVEVEHETD